MPAPKKLQIVEDLKGRIDRSTIAIGAAYQGLRVSEMNELRRQLRLKGVDVRVVKNTLLRLAANEVDQPELSQLIEGPSAIVFGYGDVVETAKVVTEYAQQAKNAFAVRGAYLDGRVLSAKEVGELATLPPRPILIGRLAGALNGPMYKLVQLLTGSLVLPTGQLINSSLCQFQGLLEARANQLEQAS